MADRIDYRLEGRTATLALDDGQVNALSLAMLQEIGASLDRAEADGAVVVLTGRQGVFSAGFDLPVLQAGGPAALEMLKAGFELAHRVLSFPAPVVVACSGHAVAMGVFLLLSADYRIGVSGASHRIAANEVAIGLTVPRAALEICRQRLVPAAFQRAVNLAELFTPDTAVAAGFLDVVVPEGELRAVAQATAERLAGRDLAAHAATKRRARETTLAALRAAIEADPAELLAAAAPSGPPSG